MYVNTKIYADKYNMTVPQINYLIKIKKIKSAIKKGNTFLIDNDEDFNNNDDFIIKDFPYITLQEYADKYKLTLAQTKILFKKNLLIDVGIANLVLIDKNTPKYTLEKNNSKCCKDHLGNEYKSISEMCRAYGTTYHKFNELMKYNKHKFDNENNLIKHCLTGK